MRTEKISAPQARAAHTRAAGWVRESLRAELAALADPALWLALGGLLLVFLLVPQLPLRYRFDVGYEEGPGSDLPYLRGFNTAERDELGTYRWTDDGATILVPGVGARSLLVRLSWLPMPEAALPLAPQRYELVAGGRSLGQLPLRPEGGIQLVSVPAVALASGELMLTIRSDTFTLPGDPRRLGARLSGVAVTALVPAGFVAPAWGPATGWLGAVVLGWLAARHALSGPRPGTGAGRGLREGQPWPVFVLTVGAVLVAAAALLDPPRWAFGAEAALVACGLAYPLAIATRASLPPLARRLGVPLDGVSLAWLSFLIVLSFALRIGGRLYPDSMHGDIGFHHNRFNEAMWGLIYIVSVNRGVDFPYPPGPYTLVAPLTLLGLGPRAVLQLGAALADAVSAAVIYAIAARVAGQRTALRAAGIYVFTAATFMASWWSFDTHIYTQFLHLLLVAALVWGLEVWGGGGEAENTGPGPRAPATAPAPGARNASAGALPLRGVRRASLAVGLLLTLVFLGHFGFLINTVLLLGLLVVAVWLASWRGEAWARTARWPLTLTVVGAGLFAGLFFYTAYLPLFLGQLEIAREGGLTAVAGRGPVSRAVMWERLWRDGFVVHFGLFPLLLMPWGLWLLWRGARAEAGMGPKRVVAWLALGSLAVAGVFAIFPFATGVTNSPRWMLFLAWTVALTAALAAEALWRRGWWGRAATLVMGATVLANTAWVWLGPMLWRVRPPEPF